MPRPKMTKQAFEIIAEAIHELYEEAEQRGVASGVRSSLWGVSIGTIVSAFETTLKATNPSFNADKFREACLTGKHIRASIRGL